MNDKNQSTPKTRQKHSTWLVNAVKLKRKQHAHFEHSSEVREEANGTLSWPSISLNQVSKTKSSLRDEKWNQSTWRLTRFNQLYWIDIYLMRTQTELAYMASHTSISFYSIAKGNFRDLFFHGNMLYNWGTERKNNE